jgi:hypothetical protein
MRYQDKLSSKWTDRETVVKVGFKPAQIILDGGKSIVSNFRRLKMFERKVIVGSKLN